MRMGWERKAEKQRQPPRRFAGLAMLLLAAFMFLPLPDETGWTPQAQADDDGGGEGGIGGVDGHNASGFKFRKAKKAKPRARPRPAIIALDLPDEALAEAARRGFTILRDERLGAAGIRVQRLRPPRNTSLARSREILAGLGATAVDVNSSYRPQSDKPCHGEDCAAPQLIGWSPAAASACRASPSVGLVDTHVDTAHPALAGQIVEVVDLRPEGSHRSGSSHGTAIAALIAGKETDGVSGLLPSARIIVAVPYYRTSRGDNRAEAFDVVRALDTLLARRPHVINMSLTGPPNAVIERILLRAAELGVPMVAAAGNAGARARPLYPAAYETAVAVTAVSTSLRIYRRASQGPHVDFAAPGVDLRIPAATRRTDRRTGTSFAAPFVSAAIAVLRQAQPDASVAEVVGQFAASARDLGAPGKDPVFGWGLIQASCPQAPQ